MFPARRPFPRGRKCGCLDLPGVRGADADPSLFHEGTGTPWHCATVSCWWHFPIDLDESCQDRVSAPRAEAFSARPKVRLPGSSRCPRGRSRSFAFSLGKFHTVLLCHSQLLGAFSDRSRRELSESRVASPLGGIFRAVESAFAWIYPVSTAQMPILRLFTTEIQHRAIVPQSAARGIPR